MGTWTRLGRRKTAKAEIQRILGHPENAIAVHYSCESFYDRPSGTSPRVTSIAVRALATGQTTSFSIHQVAEREHISPAELDQQYDTLERLMLDEFYDFVRRNSNAVWIHWNMRDINYGFPALAHRYRVLGGQPIEIHDSHLIDLARVLVSLYGINYVGHPRLLRLVEKNKITKLNFLSGQEEADAFDAHEYVKLHQSTLRKVDIFANIIERTGDGTLATNARRREIYGGYLGWVYEILREHPFIALLSLIGSLASIWALFK
jgi:hypothetical protein